MYFRNFSLVFIKECHRIVVSVGPGSYRIFCFHVFKVSAATRSQNAFGNCWRVCAYERERATEANACFHVNGNILGRGDNCVCAEREHLWAVAAFSWELKKAEGWMGEGRTSDFSLTLGDSVLGSIPGLCPAVSFGSETARAPRVPQLPNWSASWHYNFLWACSCIVVFSHLWSSAPIPTFS